MSEKYLREIRNWVRVAGILMIASIVIGIMFGIAVTRDLKIVTSPPSAASNCMSVGGADPSC